MLSIGTGTGFHGKKVFISHKRWKSVSPIHFFKIEKRISCDCEIVRIRHVFGDGRSKSFTFFFKQLLTLRDGACGGELVITFQPQWESYLKCRRNGRYVNRRYAIGPKVFAGPPETVLRHRFPLLGVELTWYLRLTGAAGRRATDCGLLVRAAARHFAAGPHLRDAELPVLLRQHFPLGDTGAVALEGRDGRHQGEDGAGHPQRRPDQHGGREALFLLVRRPRQDLRRPVPHLAAGPTRSGAPAIDLYHRPALATDFR